MTRFTWDPALGLPQLLAASDGTRCLQGLGLEGVQKDGQWSYPLPDLLGSVRQWSDAGGAVFATADYDPYGNRLSQTGTRPAPIGFAGEWEDGATGLQYLRARWYSPAQARFTQVDPFPGLSTLPATQHPYMYGLNNPALYTDPSGEFVPVIIGAIIAGGLIGAAVGGGMYTVSHPDLSWCELFHSPGFRAAVVGGFVGGAVGAALGLVIPTPGLIGAIVGGALSGAISAGFERIAMNLVLGSAWDADLGSAILGGMIGGAIGGAIGYGFGRLLGGGGCPGGVCETGPECFPAGTQVATQDGTESIETIAVGERVLAKDPKTGETGYYPVTEVFSHTADALVELTIAGEVVSATLEHPFQVQNRGWVAAGELRPGDCVESAAGVCREVERTRVVPGSITVYNFTVEKAHTYFVGSGRWWVHNKCFVSRPAGSNPLGDPQKRAYWKQARQLMDRLVPGYRTRFASFDPRVHHRIPLEYAHLFPKADPNRLSNLYLLPNNIHEQVANDAWRIFGEAFPNATPAQVRWFAGYLDSFIAPYILH